MAIEVKLPELGEGVTEGELIKWLVKAGDIVKPDQPVVEIMTDKATVEVPSPIGGIVKDLKYKAGDVIPVEKVLLTLDETGNSSSTVKTTTSSVQPPAGATAAAGPAPHSTPHSAMAASNGFYPPIADSKILATPSTRRLAREMSIDINQLSGSGLAGRVTREDVLLVKKHQTSTASITKGALEERIPLRGIRKKIAENLQLAKRIIPHFTLMDEANVSQLVSLRESLKEFAENNNVKVTFLPFVIKALISTIRQFPMFNACIDDASQEIVYKKYFNIGFAADTPNGLVVPVIKNADQKSILEISQEIMDLSKRARDGKLKPEEMKGATITITNIGSIGGTYATPIINHPEVAILGMYKIQDKLILGENNSVDVIKVMNFTITADHRLIDGAVAANFLKNFISKIGNPSLLMLDMK